MGRSAPLRETIGCGGVSPQQVSSRNTHIRDAEGGRPSTDLATAVTWADARPQQEDRGRRRPGSRTVKSTWIGAHAEGEPLRIAPSTSA